MTAPMHDAKTLLSRLRDESERLSGSSLDRGCAGCGIAANVADEAETVIRTLCEGLTKALDDIRIGCGNIDREIARAASAEAKLSALEVGRLTRAGARLANIVYNLDQAGVVHPADLAMLKAAQLEWDAARTAGGKDD